MAERYACLNSAQERLIRPAAEFRESGRFRRGATGRSAYQALARSITPTASRVCARWASSTLASEPQLECLATLCPAMVDIGMENPNLGDALHRQLVARRRPSDCLGRRRVVHAERPLPVGTDERVDPDNLIREVGQIPMKVTATHHARPACRLHREGSHPVRKLSLDDVAWHDVRPVACTYE